MRTFQAPKNLRDNVLFRKELGEACRDPVIGAEIRKDVLTACYNDPVFFIDTFCWTYAVKDSADDPDVPFITWDYQADAIRKINAAIGKHELLIEKARDMGATWIVLAAFLYRWMFRRRQSFLIGSRKEDLVDQTGNPGCLFWKIRYMISMLPSWLRPPGDLITDNSMHLENHLTGSVIDGESTNNDFARGDRRTAIMLDEFAAVENGVEILSATRDATNCRIFVSTPKGAVGAFYDTRQTMMKNSPERIIRLDWMLHPLKRAGLYRANKGGKLELFDDSHDLGPQYPYIYDGKMRSTWLDEQYRRAANPQEIAQEVEIDYAASGWQFFSEQALQPLLARTSQPLSRGELTYEDGGLNPRWVPSGETSGGMSFNSPRMQLWIPLDAKGHPAPGDYYVSADVAVGNASSESSSSVISVGDARTKKKVAQFSSNAIKSYDLGYYAIALCHWFHGAKLVWETNGPGGSFTKVVRECGYANVFGRVSALSEDMIGWHSNKEKKELLLQEYARALMESMFENPCREAVEELREYVHAPDGSIVHSKSRKSHDPTSSKANHGDKVIADALLWMLMSERVGPGKSEEEVTEYPVNSFGWRREQWVRANREVSYY